MCLPAWRCESVNFDSICLQVYTCLQPDSPLFAIHSSPALLAYGVKIHDRDCQNVSPIMSTWST